MFCLTIGAVASLLFNAVIEHFFFSAATLLFWLQASTAIGMLGSIIYFLGMLLLIQEQRRQKQAQTSALAVP